MRPNKKVRAAQLTASLPGWPVMALVGGDGEPIEWAAGDLMRLMRSGVSQVVALPPRITDLKEALDRIAVQFFHADGQPSIIGCQVPHSLSGPSLLDSSLDSSGRFAPLDVP
jgi:hypothetical protein